MELIYFIFFITITTFIYTIYRMLNESNLIEKRVSNFIAKEISREKFSLNREFTSKLQSDLNNWKLANEFEIRRSARNLNKPDILNSISNEYTIIGKNFAFNPNEIKYIGRFIDLIIFDGASTDQEINIYFINILNPNNNLEYKKNKIEVRKAIEKQNYSFTEVNL